METRFVLTSIDNKTVTYDLGAGPRPAESSFYAAGYGNFIVIEHHTMKSFGVRQVPVSAVTVNGATFDDDLDAVEAVNALDVWVERNGGDIPTPAASEVSATDATHSEITGGNVQAQLNSADAKIHTANNDIASEVTRAQSAETALNPRVGTVESKIPATANADNKLADQDFVNSSIQNVAANRVSYDASGSPFPTRAALLAATSFYHGGAEYTPTEHDYALISADEAAPAPYTGGQTRMEKSGDGWAYAYGINERPFTAAENAALASGITAEKVATYDDLTQSAVKLTGNQTIAGTKTFSALPRSSGTPTVSTQLTPKSYVDGLVGGGGKMKYDLQQDFTIYEDSNVMIYIKSPNVNYCYVKNKTSATLSMGLSARAFISGQNVLNIITGNISLGAGAEHGIYAGSGIHFEATVLILNGNSGILAGTITWGYFYVNSQTYYVGRFTP